MRSIYPLLRSHLMFCRWYNGAYACPKNTECRWLLHCQDVWETLAVFRLYVAEVIEKENEEYVAKVFKRHNQTMKLVETNEGSLLAIKDIVRKLSKSIQSSSTWYKGMQSFTTDLSDPFFSLQQMNLLTGYPFRLRQLDPQAYIANIFFFSIHKTKICCLYTFLLKAILYNVQ